MSGYNQANAVFSYVKRLRKYFHINPELSGHEKNTYYRITSELKKMKVDYQTIGDYSIVAYINKDKENKKNIAFRTQMDAIPLKDLGKFPYKSSQPNISHSSGHDISMAVLLGAIKSIKDREDRYDGCITFIFEASGHTYKGAKEIINSGALLNVDYLFSLLCTTDIPNNSGAMYFTQQLLGADVLEIKWYGQAQPSSYVYVSKDTIMAAANFTDGIRDRISSRLSPAKIGIATVTKFLGGHIHDVTANYCELNLNLRYEDSETRAKIHTAINEALKSSEKRFRVTTEDRIIYSIPPLIPNKKAVELGKESFLNINKDFTFISEGLPIYSEGFSLYGTKTKCSLGIFGANNLNTEFSPSSSETFSPEESSLKTGVAWYVELANLYLDKK